MEQAYLQMIRKEDHYDHDGSELLVILSRRSSFYLKLLEQLADERQINRTDHQKIGKVWALADPTALLEKAVNFLTAHQRYHFHVEELLSDLFENTAAVNQFEEKRLAFLTAYIKKNAGNQKRMQAIFKTVGSKMQQYFAGLVQTYLFANKRFDHFARIRWDEHGLRLLSGDTIAAELNERAWNRVKEVLEAMQPAADYLEHRVFVGKQIAYSQRAAIRERKHHFLRQDY